MRISLTNIKDYFFSLFHLGVFAAILIIVYERFIYLPNRSWGMKPLEYTEINLLLTLGIVLPTISLFFVRLGFKPTRIFSAVYSFVVVLPYITLNGVSGVISSSELLISIFLLLIPLFLVTLIANISFIRLPAIRSNLRESWSHYLFIVFTIIGLSIFMLNPPSAAGFSFLDSYARRFEVRDLYEGSLYAYLMVAMLNTVLPYIGFLGGYLNRKFYIAIAVLGCLFFYWLAGNKAQFLWAVVGISFGIICRNQSSTKNLQQFLFLAVRLIILILIIEFFIFDGYSPISDFFLRRMFVLSAQTQGYYYDAILSNQIAGWTPFLGGVENGPFYISETYFNRPEVRANTSGFLHIFLERGIFGYIFTVTLAALFLRILDSLFARSGKMDYCFLALIFSFLITEQKITIIFVSSGVFALFLFVSLLPRRLQSRTIET